MGPGHSQCREVAVELAGSVLVGQLQPLAASRGNRRYSQDDDKYPWPACFELRHDFIRIIEPFMNKLTIAYP